MFHFLSSAHRRFLGSLLLAASVFSFPLPAQQSAAEWLQASREVTERAPLRVNSTLRIDLPQGAAPMTSQMTSQMLYADAGRMRIDLGITIEAAALGGRLESEGLIVLDGESAWIQLDNPMSGQQVMRLPLERSQELGQMIGLPGFEAGFDPFSQLEALSRHMVFEIAEDDSENGVALVGTATPEFEEQFGATAAMLGQQLRLELDDEAKPLRVVMGSDAEPTLEMTFASYEFLQAGDIGATAFAYTPAPGTAVLEP